MVHFGIFYADPVEVDVNFHFVKRWTPSGQFSRKPEQMSTTRGAVPSILLLVAAPDLCNLHWWWH